jgi:dipeptidyl-peptidase-4
VRAAIHNGKNAVMSTTSRDEAIERSAPSTHQDESQPSFLRQFARTQGFTLGVPRAFAIAPDGERVLFLRSPSATSRSTGLWSFDTTTGKETMLADPEELLGGAAENLPPEELARRERTREGTAGIVAFAVDGAVGLAAFALSSRLFVADTRGVGVRELPAAGPVLDPRPDPTGRRVAYVTGGALRVIDVDDADPVDRALLTPETPGVTYGLAEFIAAEEMSRYRGYWWAPDGNRLLVARVDETPVARLHIADPAMPSKPPAEVRYPAAGTANATVSASIVDLEGQVTPVRWDIDAFPYLADVHWSAGGAPLLAVQDRAQRRLVTLAVDLVSGATSVLAEESDPIWVELLPGSPAWTPDGRLVRLAVRAGRNRLLVGEDVLTGDDLHVRGIVDVGDDAVVVSASADDPTQLHLYRVATDGQGGVLRLTTRAGYHRGASRGGLAVVLTATLDSPVRTVTLLRHEASGVSPSGEIASLAATPPLTVNVRMLTVGERDWRAALLLPRDHVPGTRLPVVLDPYGGPHAQMVQHAQPIFLRAQWLADQGFAVLVVDGRGTPGRDVAWEQSIHHDFAGVTLADQVDALHAVAALEPDLDLSRVGIRGWSYGGYLAALAVLRRPDVFHAAVAGAPVTDWLLYDTHYTERYLGHPDEPATERSESGAAVYERNSLMTGWQEPNRPLLLIHGLADDNVVAAHTLRLSAALLAAGRAHQVLPLSGVTHMTPQEVVTENLAKLQIEFLREALDR